MRRGFVGEKEEFGAVRVRSIKALGVLHGSVNGYYFSTPIEQGKRYAQYWNMCTQHFAESPKVCLPLVAHPEAIMYPSPLYMPSLCHPVSPCHPLQHWPMVTVAHSALFIGQLSGEALVRGRLTHTLWQFHAVGATAATITTSAATN